MHKMELKIGFISTRLAGTDGVSLETAKWAKVLKEEGHDCYFMAGEIDTPAEKSFLFEECSFDHPAIKEIDCGCFGRNIRKIETSRLIQEMKVKIKKGIREFIAKFDLDLIIPENALTIPMNIPLGLAITEIAVETGIQMIAHHHDFFWERKRFLKNGCWDYLNKAFPPHLPMIQHTVLNSSQDNQLSLRTGISATIIPNVMDFANPPAPPDEYTDDLREALGIGPDEKFILQPTRIVQRKGIEHAIELVHRIDMDAKLVISHASGDEGDEYSERVVDYSKLLGVDTVFCSDIVDEKRGSNSKGKKIYTLSDLYQKCDLVTYPSTIEGFGNAFLEALYYKCPVMVNNYSIYNSDIGPKGFKTILMDDYVSKKTVADTEKILNDSALKDKWAKINYDLGSRYFSHDIVRQKLNTLIMDCFGA